jgi:single-strand DNA-binding protein
VQQLTITGYLSKDAETSTTQGGQNVTRWNVPVRQGWGDREQTNWYRVSIWGKRAEFAAKARKGEFVTVTGDLAIGEYNGKPQYEINAADFQNIRPAPRDASQQTSGGGGDGWTGQAPTNHGDDLDDNIPFATRNSIY